MAPEDTDEHPALVVSGRLLLDPERPPEPGWLVVRGGRIEEVNSGDAPREAPGLILGGRDRLVSPAFTDAHCHLPQFDAIGADGLSLLDWLERVVYPAEGAWAEPGARRALRDTRTALARMSAEGTCAFAGYLTSDPDSAERVRDWLAERSPLRAIVGRVAMDRNAPDALTGPDRRRRSGAGASSPVLGRAEAGGRVRISANPRFGIACSAELLGEIGAAARSDAGLVVQTHLSETREEVERVARLFPGSPDYASVYDEAGLLTPRTLLGHCLHLGDREWALLAQRSCVVVHCPTANLFLRAGRFDLDKAREHGVRLALGSDVGAGPDVAMPRVARAMIETAKSRSMSSGGARWIPTPAQAWDMITRTGPRELGWDDAGVIGAGAPADLLVLRPPEAWFDEHLPGRLIYAWSSRLIETRVFDGRIVRPDTI